MPKFQVAPHQTGPNAVPTAPHQHTDNHWYAAGEVIESDVDLCEMFPGKFRRRADSAKATPKEKEPVRTGHLGVKIVDDKDAFKSEAQLKEAKQKEAKTLSRAIGSDEDFDREELLEANAEAVRDGDSSPHPLQDQPVEGEQGDKVPAKAKVPAKKAGEKKPAKDAEEGGDEDVTEKFPAAGAADLTVIKGKDGYMVKDGARTVSKEPLAKTADVKKFLKEHAATEE